MSDAGAHGPHEQHGIDAAAIVTALRTHAASDGREAAGAPRPERARRSVRRLVVRVLVGVVVLVAGVLAFATYALRASLPRESGSLRLAGLSAAATVERDGLGAPVIRGKTLEDVCRAEGFVHAQERFFQMDLARRGAAGEISELMGRAGLAIDREGRPLRFRAHAREVIERLPEAHKRLLKAYTEGVNAGLNDLGASPPEYLLLRASPAAWKEEDCVLVVFLMFRFLNYTSVNEKALGTMRQTLPKEMVEFLTPEVTRWDVPMLVKDEAAEQAAREPMVVPGSGVLDLRAEGAKASRRQGIEAAESEAILTFAQLRAALVGEGLEIGSNNWAVAASRSKTGAAMVANDMHLGISEPNTWFRVQMEWEEGNGAKRRAVGVSLPGTPAIVAGSNGFLAWGFTNVEADVQDLIVIAVDPADEGRYLAPAPGTRKGWAGGKPDEWRSGGARESIAGSEPFGEIVETLNIHGAAPETMTLRTTRWGVVTGADCEGRPLVLKWTALDADKVNVGVFDMLGAKNVDEGVAVARRMFIPPQNVVMADSSGRIAWCVCGWLPKRVGVDGKFPASWVGRAEGGGDFGWDGQIDEAARPCVIDPPGGALWSANNRTTGWPACRDYGNSWSPSDRAGRIAAMLGALDKFDERDLLKMQLDVKAETLEFYRSLIAGLSAEGTPEDAALLARAKALAAKWDGTAGADQSAFRLIRAFRLDLSKAVFGAITAPCKQADDKFAYDWFLSDEPLTRILEERPPHLLPAPDKHADWPAFLRHILLETARRLDDPTIGGLNRTWGQANVLAGRHPISSGVPLLGRWLDMPKNELPGSGMTVRAQGRTFGASERFVVSPGKEESALFEMPGGQSGHFLSKHFADGHAAWVRGDPTPLLAGAPAKTLTFTP